MIIIGFGGTNGSGKGVIAQLLAERFGFYYGSATEMLKTELLKRGLPLDREHKSQLSAEWRRQYGMAAIVDRAVEHYEAHKDQYKGVVVESLRHPGEADRVHELGGTMIWVDADPQVRYKRVIANPVARGRAAEDNKSFEAFMAEEAREMQPVGDGATLNMTAVKDRCDLTVQNNGNDLEAFRQEVTAQLQKLIHPEA